MKRPPREVPNYSLMYNLRTEVDPKPPIFRYDQYIADGIEFNNRQDLKILAINGVKGVWAFHVLPYAAHIYMTKDRMHTGDHIVKDSLNVLSRTVTGHVNRTEKKLLGMHAKQIEYSHSYTPKKESCELRGVQTNI